MFELSKTYRFEASHRLPFHDGKCARLHGHSWEVAVTFRGDELVHSGPKAGMLLDYGDVSEVIKPIIEALDHQHLNDVIPNPTSELLAGHLWEMIVTRAGTLTRMAELLWAIEIGETCTSRCRFEKRITAYDAMLIEKAASNNAGIARVVRRTPRGPWGDPIQDAGDAAHAARSRRDLRFFSGLRAMRDMVKDKGRPLAMDLYSELAKLWEER
jgi:6-pyruvoyltetrahydropterin/6-carboxytetrahydropterin synthase